MVVTSSTPGITSLKMAFKLNKPIHILAYRENASKKVVHSKLNLILKSRRTLALLFRQPLLNSQHQFSLMLKHGNSILQEYFLIARQARKTIWSWLLDTNLTSGTLKTHGELHGESKVIFNLLWEIHAVSAITLDSLIYELIKYKLNINYKIELN